MIGKTKRVIEEPAIICKNEAKTVFVNLDVNEEEKE